MTQPFSNQELEQLAAQVEAELRELAAFPPDSEHKGVMTPDGKKTVPPKQSRVLETLSGESTASFWDKFKRAAKADLCDQGGVLNQQWQKYGDLNKKDTVNAFGAVLAAMGFSGNALSMLAVALVVIVLHISVKTVCMEA